MLALLVTVAITSSKANWHPFRAPCSSAYLPRRYETDVMRVACYTWQTQFPGQRVLVRQRVHG